MKLFKNDLEGDYLFRDQNPVWERSYSVWTLRYTIYF